MEAIPWGKVSIEKLVSQLVEKFTDFSWNLYDGVKDEYPYEVTYLDCKLSRKMRSRFCMKDWEIFIKSSLKSEVDNLLQNFGSSISLWEETSSVNEFLEEFKTLLCNKLITASGWGVSKLTKVLHRKRPRLIPILDSKVQDVYCLRRMDLRGPQPQKRIERGIVTLQEFRKELMHHLQEIQKIAYLAHKANPSIIPVELTPVRCLEALIYWRGLSFDFLFSSQPPANKLT